MENTVYSNTGNDEMCNFYMMYWVDGDHIMKNSYCFTEGPPGWNWGKFPNINADGAPMNASIVPGKLCLLLLLFTKNIYNLAYTL